MMAQQEANKFE